MCARGQGVLFLLMVSAILRNLVFEALISFLESEIPYAWRCRRDPRRRTTDSRIPWLEFVIFVILEVKSMNRQLVANRGSSPRNYCCSSESWSSSPSRPSQWLDMLCFVNVLNRSPWEALLPLSCKCWPSERSWSSGSRLPDSRMKESPVHQQHESTVVDHMHRQQTTFLRTTEDHFSNEKACLRSAKSRSP